MKLRKLRKKTHPTRKKVVRLLPYEERLEALKKAVDTYNYLIDVYRIVCDKVEDSMKGLSNEI